MQKALGFVLTLTILITGGFLPPAQGQSGDGKQAKQVLDTYVSVVSKVYPPAGGVFGAMLQMLEFTGYFGKSADPVGEALKAINSRLDAQEQQINALSTGLQELRKDVRGESNWNRFNRLQDSSNELKTIAERLDLKPTEMDAKIQLAGDARGLAARFLDPEMWKWSDLSLKDQSWTNRLGEVENFKAGDMTEPDFKSMPTLEYYTTAIVVWAATIEYASGGDTRAIQRQYGADLQKHIAYLTQRPDWYDRNGAEPQTLPEQVKARITGSYVPGKYPDAAGVCYVNQHVRDDMRRTFNSAEPLVYAAVTRNELCNVPAARRNTAPDMERAKEREYGPDVMANLAAILINLRDKGTVKGAPTVSAPSAQSSSSTGAPAAPFTGRHKAMFEELGFKSSGGATEEFNILYSVSPDGTLTWYRHIIRYPNGNKDEKATHSFNPPKTIRTDWTGLRDVMPMGLMGIYGLKDDGTLTWNWHLGFADGTNNWSPSRDIAKGLTAFTQIVAQDQGILYGHIQGDPGIFWGATSNYDNKKGAPVATIGIRLTPPNINFAAFKMIFAGGKGILYGIGLDGKLYWMKHNLYQSPIPDPGTRMPGDPRYQQWLRQWSGPTEIANDVGNVKHAFSPGEGHLYFILDDGTLVYRRHATWNSATGKPSTWLPWLPGAVVIAEGWGGYKFAFARYTTSDADSGNRALDLIVN
jgi:hypothetical protein